MITGQWRKASSCGGLIERMDCSPDWKAPLDLAAQPFKASTESSWSLEEEVIFQISNHRCTAARRKAALDL